MKKLFVHSIYVPDPLTIFIGIEIAASALNYKYTTSIMPHLPILTTNLKEEILEKYGEKRTENTFLKRKFQGKI